MMAIVIIGMLLVSQSLLKSGRSEYSEGNLVSTGSVQGRNPFLNQVGLSTLSRLYLLHYKRGCRNPFLNQVGLSTYRSRAHSLPSACRNPFLNQVGLSTGSKPMKKKDTTKSQSLLKSGRSEYLLLRF